jgi:RNA 2',3'-cyclic 3'-phosphodiesterase
MRLFVAIDINNDDIEKFQNYLCKKFGFSPLYVKPTKKDNLHITINFIGEKNDLETKDLLIELTKMRFTSFKIVFNHIGIFPNMLSPKIIWLGLDDQSTEKLSGVYFQIYGILKKYADKKNNVDGAVKDSDIKKFVPHLTVFRIRNNHRIPDLSSSSRRVISEGEVNKISLKKSTITSNGPIYSDLFNIYADKKDD